jgi:hypothetical protein
MSSTAAGWTGLRADGRSPSVYFVGVFSLDGLYGQANLGIGGTLQVKRRITIRLRKYNLRNRGKPRSSPENRRASNIRGRAVVADALRVER